LGDPEALPLWKELLQARELFALYCKKIHVKKILKFLTFTKWEQLPILSA
jgi:hypothetical protein